MADTSAPKSPEEQSEAKQLNRAHFELELEFVQALANPYYLHSLAQQGILSQPSFVNYLKYLQYWKKREYARFLHYPHALHHLDLLQNEQFRKEIGTDAWRDKLNQLQYEHWKSWRQNPLELSGKHTTVKVDPEDTVAPVTTT